MLSEFRLTVGGRPMSLLGASLSQDNVLFTSNLTNLPIQSAVGRDIPQGAIHIERVRLIWQDRLFERITLSNYSREHSTITVSLHFAADFRDMFEVRGSTRVKRGTTHLAKTDKESVMLGYDGLDGLPRLSAISFSQAPDQLSDNRADFLIAVTKRSQKVLYIEVGPEVSEAPSRDRFPRRRRHELASACVPSGVMALRCTVRAAPTWHCSHRLPTGLSLPASPGSRRRSAATG
ncbi:glycogen debranching N-terminal domain-containing protein [Mesorhizobium sp. M2A.F.Ca.ET.043.02.1.1]|uniref:glycogen debranching N-terminal domain-containing protein n=1 Tax=Mesorhizobium sp. M2A.F.Ca.ET.043.02.1.1 TaxID=2493670 RepID=UPI001FE00D53|nr:glycogen debranching N-terminal domain-containing protein [Mesorhizobium sp. M2A.F.Ca.ET.043.02.1.1]